MNKDCGVNINGRKLFNLHFADSIALITEIREEFISLIELLINHSTSTVLQINATSLKNETHKEVERRIYQACKSYGALLDKTLNAKSKKGSDGYVHTACVNRWLTNMGTVEEIY